MDIVERLKQEFSGNALKDVADQMHVYVKERHEAADEIERLRETLSECHEYISQYSKYEMRQYEMKHENNYVVVPNEAMWLSFKIEKLLGKKE